MFAEATKSAEQKNSTPSKQGNRNLFFQPKLTINEPGDQYEREADDMAERVMRMPAGNDFFFQPKPTSSIQRKCNECEKEEKEKIQRKPDDAMVQREPDDLKFPELKLHASSLFEPKDGPDYLSMRQPFLLRGIPHLWDADSALGIWQFNFNFFKKVGLSDGLSTSLTNFTAPRFIDSQLKAGNPTWWEITDRDLNTTSYVGSIPILDFNADFSPTAPSWYKTLFKSGGSKVQRKESSNEVSEAANDVSNYIGSLSSKGSLLPSSTKNFFESRFGYDFSDVKVHTDSAASKSAQSINAHAYTTGKNIVFNQNQFSPESDSGKKLLAHELTHVIQQQNSIARAPDQQQPSRQWKKGGEPGYGPIISLHMRNNKQEMKEFEGFALVYHGQEIEGQTIGSYLGRLISCVDSEHFFVDAGFFQMVFLDNPYPLHTTPPELALNLEYQEPGLGATGTKFAAKDSTPVWGQLSMGDRPYGWMPNFQTFFQIEISKKGTLKIRAVFGAADGYSESVFDDSIEIIRCLPAKKCMENVIHTNGWVVVPADGSAIHRFSGYPPNYGARYEILSELGNVQNFICLGEQRVYLDPSGYTDQPQAKPADNTIQRKCSECEKEDEEILHRKESSNQNQEVRSELSGYVDSLSSKGSSLSPSAKNFFEPRFGYDFSEVKIHHDNEASKSAQSINALAYTSGNNIVFNQNQFSPESDSGKKLLAHELTHVVQQQLGVAPKMIQCERELDPTESKVCMDKIEASIVALESTAANPQMALSDYVKKAIEQLRKLKTDGKLKCYSFEGIKHGRIDYNKDELQLDGINTNWISESTLLHEGVHYLHFKQFPTGGKAYGKALAANKAIDGTKPEDLKLMKWKAWTEYWAYRSQSDYYNPTLRTPKSDDEIHNEVMRIHEVRIAVNEVKAFDQNFDVRTYKPQ